MASNVVYRNCTESSVQAREVKLLRFGLFGGNRTSFELGPTASALPTVPRAQGNQGDDPED
jgi:hypothetical protein